MCTYTNLWIPGVCTCALILLFAPLSGTFGKLDTFVFPGRWERLALGPDADTLSAFSVAHGPESQHSKYACIENTRPSRQNEDDVDERDERRDYECGEFVWVVEVFVLGDHVHRLGRICR